jgi:hypothetical protein
MADTAARHPADAGQHLEHSHAAAEALFERAQS